MAIDYVQQNVNSITEITYSLLDTNNILLAEQKGCMKRSYSCKDQFLINKMLQENSGFNHRNLSTAWTDIAKKLLTVYHTHES